MSWFDAAGIASLAKTALKEAQKTIDKALDITEDEDGNVGDPTLKLSTSVSELSAKTVEAVSEPDINGGSEKMLKQSVSNPILSSVATGTTASNLWDSFTGTFFDATSSNDDRIKPAVTIAPSSTSELRSFDKRETTMSNVTSNAARTTSANTSGRTSSASISESVEMLSSPITPSSELTSPSTNFPVISSSSCTTLQHSQTPSESIEVIDTTDTPTTTNSELISPDSVISTTTALTPTSCPSISDSVEIIDDSHTTSLSKQSVPVSSSAEEIPASRFNHVDDDDDESMSVSYNSVSESTAPVTVTSRSVDVEHSKPITTPPSRTSLTLTLAPTHQSNAKINKTTTESKLKPPMERSLESFEAQTQLSDSTQSFEDVQQILLDEASANQKKQAAAIASIGRDGSSSPQSSDDKLDLVKISAPTVSEAHNSGHTSADEMETATSSDIEIISGPNGDSSSTNSIAGITACKSSPMKMSGIQCSQYVVYDAKRKGHNRELSGTSSYSMQSESGSDAHSLSEIEKLQHRIADLTEVVEVREYKLVELGRENAQLYEKNAELKHQLDGVQSRADSTEATTLAEEYTQRMSALERKFQQTLRERDNFRVELKTIQNSLSRSISKEEIDRLVKEKDEMIDELKREGEKLSKQILQHSTLVKKLRAKEKESDAQIKHQTEQIDEITSELDRTKKSLSAKDEMERTQMEAVHKLTSENKRLSKELAKLRSEFDDLVQRLRTLQTSFDAAKNELNEKRQEMQSMLHKTKNLTTLQTENQQLQQQNQQLAHELETLRDKLQSGSAEQSGQHQKLRQENAGLVRRLEEIEQRAEDHAQAISEATIPLVRQCDALQASLNTRTLAWEKQEMSFVKKIEALERQVANVTVVERTATEQTEQLNARIRNLEDSLSQALLRSEQAATALQQKQMELDLLESDVRIKQTTAEDDQQKYEKTIDELTTKVTELQEQLKLAQENEQKRTLNASQLSESKSVAFHGSSDNGSGGDTSDKYDRELSLLKENSSPTMSVADSHVSNQWPMDDLDSVSMIGGQNRRTSTSGSMYGATSFGIGGSSALIEMLQSTLKQRDGENHQLQWQLSRLQSERNFLMSEVAKLNEQLENIKDKLATHDSVVSQFTELQEQYESILQMYGEKVEETEELQLDLQDVKDMYRAQIDDLLVQQRQLTQQLYALQEVKSDATK